MRRPTVKHPDDMGLDKVDRDLVHDSDYSRPCYSIQGCPIEEDVAHAGAALLCDEFDTLAKLPPGLRFERLVDIFHTALVPARRPAPSKGPPTRSDEPHDRGTESPASDDFDIGELLAGTEPGAVATPGITNRPGGQQGEGGAS